MTEVDLTTVAQPLWHVTVTLTGDPVPTEQLRTALNRLVEERPFMLSVRYAPDRVELRFWDEAEDVDDAAAIALRLWGDHRASAGLPSWRVVGLEVLDRETVHARGAETLARPLVAAGVTPLCPGPDWPSSGPHPRRRAPTVRIVPTSRRSGVPDLPSTA